MKIVIDIPKEIYTGEKTRGLLPTVIDAISNGTPLPEHHGRLIDADAFQQYCFNKNFDKRLSDEGLAIINLFLTFQQTIIEGSEGEK